MKTFDIYIVGVGGQGIGLLSEAMIRAIDYANLPVMGVDTHGLAQRGGMVSSHIKINGASPIVRKGACDMVVALERHEALRAAQEYLKDGGVLVYYDAVWQPLSVRLREEKSATLEMIDQIAKAKNLKIIRAFDEKLEDARMQNVILLSQLAKHNAIPDVQPENYRQAISDLMSGKVLEKNLQAFSLML